jgi:FtsH Extracellular
MFGERISSDVYPPGLNLCHPHPQGREAGGGAWRGGATNGGHGGHYSRLVLAESYLYANEYSAVLCYGCTGGCENVGMKANFRDVALGVLIVLLLPALFTLFRSPGPRTETNEFSFSQFLAEIDQGRVREVLIQDSQIYGTLADGRCFQTCAPNESALIQRLYGKGVRSQLVRSPCHGGSSSLVVGVHRVNGYVPQYFFMLRVLLRIQHALDHLSDRGKDQG